MKRFLLVFALVMLLGSGVASLFAGEVDIDLEGILKSIPPEQELSVLVYLADQVNLSAITQQMDSQRATLRQRHEAVVRALQDVAGVTQSNITNYLAALKRDGKIKDFKAFWITNAIRVDATKAEIENIASRTDVARVYYNYEIELIEPVEVKDDIPDVITTIEIGVQAVRAPEVWALGITGEGVLVANMDTGVEGSHPALADRWAGVADPRYEEHPEWAWYDPYAGQNDFPYDDNGHGTHTMGSICGASPTTGDTVGVAPGAFWIASAPIDRGGGIPRTVADAILSFQWMVDPDGDPETNWDVPAVCSNSWGLVTAHGYPPCDSLFWQYLDACEAAGTVILFSAGNEASEGLRRPADRATDDYRTCAVAAVDANDPDWPIAPFSSRGPTYCTPDGSAAIKPDIAAPGVNVRSSVPGGGYASYSGTSMASPHVNGVVALIRQANPNLSVEMVKQIIYETAYDLGSPGEDNSYGWGMVDAYEAVMLALSYLEGYGAIHGRVTDLLSGEGLSGRVIVTNHDPELVVNCNQAGYYTMFVPADSVWELRAEYTEDYLPAFADVSVEENDTLFLDFALEPKVEVILRSSFGNPEDIDYRTFYLRGSWDDDGFYDLEWSCSFSLMRDDGVSPDEIDGDGVFTGSIKLATDLTNTYNWAVYSENYNNDASRLQYGEDFDITDPGDPPVVPILEVNPSGSEHNWTLTVDGDNDLIVELLPDYNGLPYQWSGEATMNTGITYTFRIYPMHSEVASYGEGGVGGNDFVVVPNNTEEYTFIFDDNADTLVIDSSHPSPSGLTATQDMDMKIELGWSAPRIDPEAYLIYRSDDESGPFTQIDSISYAQLTYTDEPIDNYHDYYYYVSALYLDGVESIRSNITHGYAVIGARLSVSPDNFDIYVQVGESITANMYISNDGDLDLIYDIATSEDVAQVLSGEQVGQKPLESKNNYLEKTYTKLQEPSVPQNPPQILDSGGPDEFGYAWIDSDEPDGPQFNWIDISSIGIPIDFGADIDDGNSGPLPLGFSFQFYGNEFNSINVCTNGWASFTDSTSVEWGNPPLPHPEPPNNMLAAFYDDLNLENGGTGYFYTNNADTAIITWDHVPDWRQEGIFTFQIILTAPAYITYQYSEMGPGRLDECSIGIEDGTGAIGLEVANDQLYVHNDLAIQFYKVWLRVAPDSGVVEPSTTDTITVTFDAYTLQVGDYTGYIDVSGHDIYHNEEPVNVVVTLHVTEEVDVPEGGGINLPDSYALYQNYPNPFNAFTTIKYNLPRASDVIIDIYNILGRKVETLIDKKQPAGYHQVIWNAYDVSSGVYLYRIQAEGYAETKKMLLLK